MLVYVVPIITQYRLMRVAITHRQIRQATEVVFVVHGHCFFVGRVLRSENASIIRERLHDGRGLLCVSKYADIYKEGDARMVFHHFLLCAIHQLIYYVCLPLRILGQLLGYRVF